jgi:hypothetical protein
MVPQSILNRLDQLRRRETWLRLAWGGACFLAIFLSLLLLACLVDWLMDQEEDTPWEVRVALFAVQVAAAGMAVGWFVIRPLLGRPSDRDLALWVEEKHPQLEHRLISAVQLNQPGAATEGMSAELIGKVTREAERQSAAIAFERVADHRRLRWSAVLAGPIVLAALITIVLWPGVMWSLFLRQGLQDVPIPHSVTLTTMTEEVWPLGERKPLRFKVIGSDLEEAQGEVVVRPDGLPSDRYPLTFVRPLGPGEALFTAPVGLTTVDFSYRARLRDGRMHKPARVRFVPRPVVIGLTAWVQLPESCGLKPDGGRYELLQPRGEVAGIPGSAARLEVRIQKQVRAAYVELLTMRARDNKGLAAERTPTAADALDEVMSRKIDLSMDAGLTRAEGTFDLRPEETAYRVVAVDEFGFVNVPAPRRSVRIIAEEPPQVNLLRDEFPPDQAFLLEGGSPDDFEVEGMPVPVGRPIRVAYSATGPYGLGRAQLLFRVVPKKDNKDGGEEPVEGKWHVLKLVEVKGSAKTGPFDPQRGAFARSGPRDAVQFHAVPSLVPEIMGRKIGGGRFDFQTAGLLDEKGQKVRLVEGDQVEYCVEVFADRDPSSPRPAGRSEVRVKNVVSVLEFVRWMGDTLQEERRVRALDQKQRGLFDIK